MSVYLKIPTNEAEALQTLAEFAKIAPGRLPERVDAAIRIAANAVTESACAACEILTVCSKHRK